MKKFFKNILQKIGNNPKAFFYLFICLYILLMIFLTYFRDMLEDEAIYYREAWLMSEVLKNGEWIGNYAVGLHGFLFKLPPAILFLLFGESITIVTIYNIILGISTGILFFKFLAIYLKNHWYAFFAVIFLMTSFYFVLGTATFLRDIPSLLVIILFMQGIVRKWNKGWMSLVFLLLLDSKEYVFLIFAVFFVIWLFISSKELGFWKKIWEVFKTSLIVFLPSLVWIVLMFTTGIIPVNMYLASTLGLVKGNLAYTLNHFSPEFVSIQLQESEKHIKSISENTEFSLFKQTFIKLYNMIILYLGKVLSAKSFSFLSIPKIVIFPVIYTSFLLVKNFLLRHRESQRIFVISAFMILIWILFYILRTSTGRYLLPILPAVGIILVFLLFFANYTNKQKLILIIGTGIFICSGFLFEDSYILPKIILESTIYIFLVFSIWGKKKEIFKRLFLLLLACSSLGIAILFSYTRGQIYAYKNWGLNREAEEIAKVLPAKERFWGNDFDGQDIISVIRNELYFSPEWHWELKDFLPKKNLLKTKGEQQSYYFYIYYDRTIPAHDMEGFKKNILDLEIQKVVILSSTIEGRNFNGQFFYDHFVNFDWLELEKEIQLKNKIVYIFDVKD